MSHISQQVNQYWFASLNNPNVSADWHIANWFTPTQDRDYDIERRFGKLVSAAGAGAFDSWANVDGGQLALILLLHEFPLSLYPGQAKAWKWQANAVTIASVATSPSLDDPLHIIKRCFQLRPLLCSENIAHLELGLRNMPSEADITDIQHPVSTTLLQYLHQQANNHHNVLTRFGRLPERNALLNRESTPEELHYLETSS